MKNYLISLFMSTFVLGLHAQDSSYAPAAIQVLEHMSEVIGEMESCRFEVNTSYDVNTYKYGIIQQSNTSQIAFSGPDKMHFDLHGSKGHRGIWYKDNLLTYYSFDENNYGTIETPATIIETFTYVHDNYDIEFPAADFFFPTFVDDVLENFTEVKYMGITKTEGVESFKILCIGEKMTAQIWISNDGFTLPVKFHIRYNSEDHLQYEALFSNWEINPKIPNAVFNFLPPAKANLVKLVSKSNTK